MTKRTSEHDGISVYMYFMKRMPQLSSDKHFEPFKADEEKESKVFIGPS